MKNDCPMTCCLTATSARRWLASWKRSISLSWRPNSLARVMPETDSVSWVTTVMADVAAWVSAVNTSRRLPTKRVAMTKNGTISSERIVSGIDNKSIATTALMNVTPFDKMFDNVLVTAALDSTDVAGDPAL